jgi:lipid-A-disaccharide synthase
VRFAVAAFKPHQAEMARKQIAAAGPSMEVHLGRTPELIRLATCCMAVSGSVSLELLYQVKPTVIQYKVSRLAYFVQGFFRKVKYITLVNLLVTDDLFPDDVTPFDPGQPGADRVLFPEYLSWEDKSDQVAAHVVEWLTDPNARDGRIARLAELKAEVGHGGASRQAAEYILRTLSHRPAPAIGPHFVSQREPAAKRNEP